MAVVKVQVYFLGFFLSGAIEASFDVQFGGFLQVIFILQADFYLVFGQFVPSWIALLSAC